MTKELQQKIQEWCKDFEKTQPKNVMIDDDTFEGSAYSLFKDVLSVCYYNECFFPITSVCRDDLSGLGYDVSKVDNATMERLAEKMGEAYTEQDFWIDLPIIADYLEIPKLKK